MGRHYASGDTRKTIHSSEDEEGYEDRSFFPTISVGLLSRLEIRDKRHFPCGTYEQPPPVPVLPIADDTDLPFWAEDELSSSESRLQLNRKQKRRHSSSYRNRIAVHRSRSLLFQSSSSSLDSAAEQISPRVKKQRQTYDTSAGRFDAGQLPGQCNVMKNAYNEVTSLSTKDKNVNSRRKSLARKRDSFLAKKRKRLINQSTSSSGNASQHH